MDGERAETEAAGRDEARPPGAALAALATPMLLSSLGVSVATAALPAIDRSFDAPFGAAQWVMLAYLLAVTAAMAGVGRFGDAVGRRRLLLGALVVFAAASLACAAAPTLWALLAARAAQGAAGAALMTLSIALVRDSAAPARTGAAIGLLGAMSALGTALGPSLGGFLTVWLGWRSIFLVMAALGGLGLVMARRAVPRDAAAPTGEVRTADIVRALLLGAALAAVATAATVGAGGPTASSMALALAAVVLGALFLHAERRAAAPLIPVALFVHASVGHGLAMVALVSAVMMATLVVGPFHLSGALGLDAAGVGLAMLAGPALSAATGAPAGRLVDRWGERAVSLAGLGLMTAGAGALALLPLCAGLAGYLGGIALLAPGYQMVQAANGAAVLAAAGRARQGVASALLGLARNLGFVLGASVLGAVYAAVSGAGASADSVATGMRAAFAVATVFLLAALAVSFAAGRR